MQLPQTATFKYEFEYHPFSYLHDRRSFGVFYDKKRMMKLTLHKRAEGKYMHGFGKPYFCMAQNFKPCFCTIIAIALQKKYYWKRDCCERWEKLDTKLMAKCPLNMEVFETWNKIFLLSNSEFFLKNRWFHLIVTSLFCFVYFSFFPWKSLNELPWRAFFKTMHSPGS